MKVKKGDTVKILTGKDSGKIGKVLTSIPKKKKVVVEGINMFKKHQKAKKSGQSGQVIEKPMPVHISNVKLNKGAKSKAKGKS